jgi:acyl-CoA thioester hydrolase
MQDTPYSGAFVDGVHRFAVRVYFEDTDLTGIVYHANYLRFMERGRSDMLRCLGIEQQAMMAAGEGYYAVHTMQLTWHAPARLDDELVVLSRIVQVRAAATVIAQDIWRGPTKLTSGVVTAAWLGANGRPQRQPMAWDSAFKALLARSRSTD